MFFLEFLAVFLSYFLSECLSSSLKLWRGNGGAVFVGGG